MDYIIALQGVVMFQFYFFVYFSVCFLLIILDLTLLFLMFFFSILMNKPYKLTQNYNKAYYTKYEKHTRVFDQNVNSCEFQTDGAKGIKAQAATCFSRLEAN